MARQIMIGHELTHEETITVCDSAWLYWRKLVEKAGRIPVEGRSPEWATEQQSIDIENLVRATTQCALDAYRVAVIHEMIQRESELVKSARRPA